MTAPSPSKRVKYSSQPVGSQFLSTALAIAASGVLSAESIMLETILGFIPADDAASNVGFRVPPILRTLAVLCRAIPGLSALVGPSNALFWRGLVLDHFDFTVDPGTTFNVDEESEYVSICRDAMIEQHSKISGEDQDWDAHPVKSYVDDWEAAHPGHPDPEKYLQHDLHFWSQLGAFFRPKEYGFLREIQCDRALISSRWPAHEDAFSLFWDLTAVQVLASAGNAYSTYSDGYNEVQPCLLGRFDDEITRPGYELLAYCDFYPHFWYGNPPVTETWTGLVGEPPSENDDVSYDTWRNQRTELPEEEQDVFPICDTKRSYLDLRRLVYERCSDWRRVHVNMEEFPSPEFYIGKSKASQRWFGLVGQSDYDAGRPHEDCEMCPSD